MNQSAVASSRSNAAARAAAFACRIAHDGIPAEVTACAKANLVYDLVCAMAAGERASPACALARGTAPATATLLGDGERVQAEQAAFANAAMIHARAQDDTHYPSQTHPGAAVIPAALAVGELCGADMDRFLAAVVAGYEVAATVGEELADAAIERGFRAAAIFGALGAATAGAVAAGLDGERTAHAIGLGASFASGLGETWTDGSDEWCYQLGSVARSGVTAALLARAGVGAAARALEGENGFGAAFAGAEAVPEWPGEPGGRWRSSEVIHKRYPACNIVQAPVAATADLVRRYGLEITDVLRVRCALHPDDWSYPGTLERPPFGGTGGALMSAPFCIAAAIAHGGLTVEALSAVHDQDVVDLTERVEIEPDPALARLDARIEIETTRGEHLAAAWRGESVSYAWSWTEIVAWARTVGDELGASGASAIDRVIAAVQHLEELPSVGALAGATVLAR